MLRQLLSKHGKNVSSGGSASSGASLQSRRLACAGPTFRAQLLQLPELHGIRHGALHLQLALHKQLLRVGCAGHHAHKVALAHGDAAVTLVHFALAHTASAVLQVNHPLLSVVASDVPLVNSLNLAHNVGVLRQLLSKHGKNISSGHAGCGRPLGHGCSTGPVLLVQCDDACAAKSEVVRQTNGSVGNLPGRSFSAQLPANFSALGKACGAEGMAFRDKSAGWVDDPFASIGDIAVRDKMTSLALGAQSKAFVSNELVGGEAVVELNDLHVRSFDASHGVRSGGGTLGHAGTNHLNHAAFKSGFCIGGHSNTDDLNSLVLKPVRDDEALGHNHGNTRPVRCGAALKLGHGVVNFWAGHDLLQRVLVSELGVRVVGTVAVVLLCDARKHFGARAVFLHVLAAGVAKHLRRHG